MIKFWTVSLLLFIVITVILSRLTIDKYKKEAGEKVWKLWGGRTTYWKLLILLSIGISASILLILHWLGFSIMP